MIPNHCSRNPEQAFSKIFNFFNISTLRPVWSFSTELIYFQFRSDLRLGNTELRSHPESFHFMLKDILVIAERTLEEISWNFCSSFSTGLVKPGKRQNDLNSGHSWWRTHLQGKWQYSEDLNTNFSGDLNSVLVWYSNGPKLLAPWIVCFWGHGLNSEIKVRYSRHGLNNELIVCYSGHRVFDW